MQINTYIFFDSLSFVFKYMYKIAFMTTLASSFHTALNLVVTGDQDLVEIVVLSLKVSLSAVVLASIIGMPVGAVIAMRSFPGRAALITLFNSLMGLPPVVLGLVVYLLLSRAGPLGEYGLLFTPTAMIIAQTLLVMPIIIALTRQALADLHFEYDEHFRSLRLGLGASTLTLLWEGRYALMTTLLAGFGRASAEVGAVMIVGGNINHVTRVMTTSIAMETSKGDFTLALALGIVLVSIVIAINTLVSIAQRMERQHK